MAVADYDFFLTRNQLIEEAYRKIGMLADGESLSAGQLDTGNKKLNSIIKSWGEDGVLLFSYHNGTIQTVPGQIEYNMPQDNGESFIEAMFLKWNNSQTDLVRVTPWEYDNFVDKSAEGVPLYFTQRVTDKKILLYHAPNEVWDVNYRAVCRLKDWETASSESQFPSRWLTALKYAVAVELAEDYRLSVREIEYLAERSIIEYRRARGKEIRSSVLTRVGGAY